MKKLIYIGILLLGFSGCTERKEVPELGYNKWDGEIPNPVMIKEITTTATGVSTAEVRIYFEFNRDSFELAWDEVDQIYFRITGGSPEDPNPPTKIVMTAPGYGYASPERGYQNEVYNFEYQLILKNGRYSEEVSGEQFVSEPN